MITAAVIAKNSSPTLTACLKSLVFCDQILVIDNGSVDDTQKIAQKFHAQVKVCPVVDDFSALRNFALKSAKHDWVLFIDADEVVPDALRREIQKILISPQYQAYYLSRRDHLWGQVLRFGDTGGIKLIRLGRKSAGVWQGRVHETWKITGKTGDLHQPLDHYPHPTMNQFITSVNYYSDIRASELFSKGERSNIWQIIFYPPGKFFYLWLVKLGFLDGVAGLVHALTMAFYTFLVRGKLYFLA
jgi:glycosyltransferase involved in cell wall biosynthesis